MSNNGQDGSKYQFVYNGYSFDVNPKYVQLTSRLMRHKIENSPEKLIITGDLPVTSFAEFAKAVNGEEFSETFENIDHLIEFAEQFEAYKLLEILYSDRENLASPESILSKAISNIRNNYPIDNYIPSIAKNIPQLIRNPKLSQLPVKDLEKVFQNKYCRTEDQRSVMNFFEALLVLKKKENPSVLFNYIKIEKLGFDDMEHFLSIKNLDRKVVVNQVAKAACALFDVKRSEAECNESEINNKKESTIETNEKLNILYSNKESIEKHAGAARHRYEEAKKKRKEAQNHMREAEAALKQEFPNESLPPMQKEVTTTKHKPNRFLEWANEDFPGDGPVAKQSSRENTRKPAKFFTTPNAVKETPKIVVERPQIRIMSSYNPGENQPQQQQQQQHSTLTVEPPKVTPTIIKIEKKASGITIEKPGKKSTELTISSA